MQLAGSPARNRIPVTNMHAIPVRVGVYEIAPNQTIEVPIEYVEQYGAYKFLKFNFSQFSEELLWKDEEGSPIVDLWSPISVIDGYGRHGLDIFRGLQQIGVKPKLRDCGTWHSLYLPNWVKDEVNFNRTKLPSKVSVMMTIPYDISDRLVQSLHKIVITQFETDTVPQAHIDWVNRHHHLIVTSQFGRGVFKNSGTKIPIDSMTAGVDTERFTLKRPVPNGIFKVLMIGAITGRKDPAAAIRIFQRASQGRRDWQFTIKTRETASFENLNLRLGPPDEQGHQKWLDDPRVIVRKEDDPPEAILWYYHNNDCLLWPSKGEGTGLPPLEAMSCGMEVVCSDNSGMRDYMNEAWAYPIKTSHMEPADDVNQERIYGKRHQGYGMDYIAAFGQVGNWWVPDEDHAVKQLERAFNNFCDGKGKGARAAAYVRQCHTLAIQASSIWKVVEKYL